MGVVDWPRAVVNAIRGAAGAVSRNVRGFVSNAAAYFTGFEFDDSLPPSAVSFANWLFGIYPRALGIRNHTPREQINGALILILWWTFWTAASGGVLIVILVPHVVLLLIGIWRWVPAFADLWDGFRDRLPIARDYDIPFWGSE